MINQMHLFKKQRFLPLFLTQFLGAFNDNIFKNALVLWITYGLGKNLGWNAQLLVTIAAGLFILPFFLFSGLAGQLADKYEKSQLIRKLKLVEVLLMVLASLSFYFENTLLLFTILFLTGTQAAFLGPVKYSILPDQLAESELLAGNGIVEAGTFLAILLGALLGGIIISLPHSQLLLSIIIITIAIVGWFCSFYIPVVPLQDRYLKINKNFFKENWELVKNLPQNRSVFLSILGISWIWFVGATFLAQFPTFVKEIIHANEQVVGIFIAMFSLGIAAGSVVCNKLLKGRIETTYLPLSALCITLFSFDLYRVSQQFNSNTLLMNVKTFILLPPSLHLLFDLLVIAMACGIYIVPLYGILQSRTEANYRSRIIAGNNIINALFMVLSAIVTSVLLALHFNIPQIFLMVALINIFIFIYICKLLPRTFLKSLLRALFKLAYNVEVEGLDNYYSVDKQAVIIANHSSFLDALILAVFLPDEITFAIDAGISKKPWLKPFLKFANAFPLEPSNPMAIKALINHVKKGHKCLIFPEGRLTVTGNLMKVYEGPGMIADKADTPILPIRIEGAEYTPFSRLKGKVRIRFFPKIKLTILPTRKISVPNNIMGRERRQAIGLELHDIMTEMMFVTGDYNSTLFQSLLDARAVHGGRHVIVQDINSTELSYNKLIRASLVVGSKIAKQTLANENVGLLLPNLSITAVTFFALQAYGRVPVMLNFSAGITNILSACEIAQLKNIYTSKKFIESAKLSPLVTEMLGKGLIINYLEDLQMKISFLDKLKGICLANNADIFYQRINRISKRNKNEMAQKPAVILFTSGSEGTPKGVVLSHKNLQANRLQLGSCADFNSNDKVFNALPLFHSFGLTAGTLLPILSGMKTFLYPSPLHYKVIPELIYSTNATILFGTDTFLANYAKKAHAYDFYSIRYIFAGAEKLKESTRKLLTEKLGGRIFEGYGVTEASPVIALNTPLKNKINSVGRLMPGIMHKIEPVENIDQGGRLWVNGPNIMLGYLLFDQPGKIVPLKDNWHDTGDIVEIDKEGYVFIKGRAKRFAKVAGEMVSLTAVENAISNLWPTAYHAVVSVPDERKGEQIVLITTHENYERNKLAIYFKEQGLPEVSIPKELITIKQIPLLATGKVDYVTAQNLVLERLSSKASEESATV